MAIERLRSFYNPNLSILKERHHYPEKHWSGSWHESQNHYFLYSGDEGKSWTLSPAQAYKIAESLLVTEQQPTFESEV